MEVMNWSWKRALFFALLFGGSIGVSIGSLINMNHGLLIGTSTTSILLLVGGTINSKSIKTIKTNWRMTLVEMLVSGICIGFVVSVMSHILINNLFISMIVGVVTGLISSFIGLSSFVSQTFSNKTVPNQGILMTQKNVFMFGLSCGSIFGLVGLLAGLSYGIIYGIIYSLIYGLIYRMSGVLMGILVGGFFIATGDAVVKHYVLRYWLHHKNHLPLKLVPFLTYATERLFLRQIGGGYIFIHRLLMEYFAAQWKATTHEKKA